MEDHIYNLSFCTLFRRLFFRGHPLMGRVWSDVVRQRFFQLWFAECAWMKPIEHDLRWDPLSMLIRSFAQAIQLQKLFLQVQDTHCSSCQLFRNKLYVDRGSTLGNKEVHLMLSQSQKRFLEEAQLLKMWDSHFYFCQVSLEQLGDNSFVI
jgi:hypothetical protein